MLAPIDVTDIRIETDRLVLRAWRYEDLDDLYEYASVPGVGEMAGWEHHQDRDVSKAILSMFIREKETFALVLKETGRVIGSLGLEEMRPHDPHGTDMQGREVGYVLSKAYWGRGLVPEAVNAAADICFKALRYDYLTCSHFLRNARSRRVIEKCGFHFLEESFFDTAWGSREPTRSYIRYASEK